MIPAPFFTEGSNMKHTVKVKTPGQMMVFRNRTFRTPVKFEKVSKDEVKFLELQCRRLHLEIDVSNYKLPEKDDPLIEEILDQKEDEDIEVEELSQKEPSTILEKLLEDE